MVQQAQHFYEFGPFCVDALKRLLVRDNQAVPLTPKALDILLVLVENSGQVVEKDELMKRVWPDSFVEEGNLTNNISTLRKALGEKPGEHQYIVTVPGRGYRFVAAVRQPTVLIVNEHQRSSVLIEEVDTNDDEKSDRTLLQKLISGSRTAAKLLRRSRVLIPATAVALALLWWLIPSPPHRPPIWALQWYDEGTQALRNGAYFSASKALEQAIAGDVKFVLAHARLAEALMELDYADRAKDEIIRAESLAPNRSALPKMDALYLQAITNVVLRESTPAIESYQAIVQLVPDHEKSQAHLDLGRAFEKDDQLEKAKENYEEATRLNPEEAAAFLRLGGLCLQQRDAVRAEQAFDKAESLYWNLSNHEGVAEVLYQRGLLFNNQGKVHEARAQLQKSLDMARTIDSKHQQIKTLLQLARTSYVGGDTALARRQATDGIDLAQSNGMENLCTEGLIDLGNAFLTQGGYPEADKYFKQALEFAQRDKGRHNEARVQLALGNSYIQQHNANEALPYLDQAIAFFQRWGYHRETSMAKRRRGYAYELKGDYDTALLVFEEQLQLAQSGGDPSMIAASHWDIGIVLTDRELYPDALDHFTQSYALYESLGNQLRVGSMLIERGNMLWRLGRYQEARAALDRASLIAAGPGDRNSQLLAKIYLINAQLALSERQLSEAATDAQQALVLNSENEHVAEAKYILGVTRVLSGAKNEGRQMCEEAVQRASHANYSRLLSSALLARAEGLLESDDAQASLSSALEAQQSFARAGQQESEWRAWLIAARASRRQGNGATARDYALRAEDLLSKLRQMWGADAYNGYHTRPDVQKSLRQLSQLLAENRPSYL